MASITNATNKFDGDGVTTHYDINFLDGYLDKSHVRAYRVNNSTLVRTEVPITPAMFVAEFRINVGSVTPVGTTLVIYRDTPAPAATDFINGTRLTEFNMDLATRQALFRTVEQEDAALERVIGWSNPYPLPAPVNGKILGWNGTGTALVNVDLPTGGSESVDVNIGPRVVVIGDSMSAQSALLGSSWPELLSNLMRQSGAPIDLINLSVGGWTYNKANTIASHGSRTMIQEAIDLQPAVVIVALGLNDLVLKVEGRSLAQVQADCNTALSALRVGLPGATIVVASEIAYDRDNFSTPGITLLNKGTIHHLMQKRASGILTDTWSSEILEDSVSAPIKANFADWQVLDSYARSHTATSASFDINLWKAVRLGGIGFDGLHLNLFGIRVLAGYAFMAASTLGALLSRWPNLSGNQLAQWKDPNTLFGGLLEPDGTGWKPRPGTTDVFSTFASMHWGDTPMARLDTWWAPSGGNVRLWPEGTDIDATYSPVFFWDIAGCTPSAVSGISINGADFSANLYGSFGTDSRGNSMGMVRNNTFGSGDFVFRIRIGKESYGPFNRKILPDTGGGGGGGPVAATAVTASLQFVPPEQVANAQQALDYLWNEIGYGYQARIGTEAEVLAERTNGTLAPNHFYRSSDTNKLWFALSTSVLLAISPQAATQIAATLSNAPLVTNVQQGLDTIWNFIATGGQAKPVTLAQLTNLESTNTLVKDHLYVTTDTNALYYALATNWVTKISSLNGTNVAATLSGVPSVTTVQQGLDTIWNFIGTGGQAKMDTEANIKALGTGGNLVSNHLYRSTDTARLFYAISNTAVITAAEHRKPHLRLTKNTTLNVTGANWNTITWNVTTDSEGGLSSSHVNLGAGTVTIPTALAGLYYVSFNITLQVGGALNYCSAAIHINGNREFDGAAPVAAANGQIIALGGSSTIRLNGGDAVTARLLPSVNGVVQAGTGNRSTFLTLTRIGD